jgi:phosphatidylglycerol---prolipoprotein diacylglyceryl transferase
MFPDLKLFGENIPIYNIFLGSGIILAVLFLENQYTKFSFPESLRIKYRLLIPLVIITGIACSILFEMILEKKEISIENFFSGGMTFYGGFLGAFFLAFIYSLVFKLHFRFLTNFLITPLSLAFAFGRIGCFFAGCCYGCPTNFPLNILYPEGSFAYQQYGEIHVHPVQLYESCSLFILFYILQKIDMKFRINVYLLCYGIIRFFLEFLRGDERGNIGVSFLSPAQLISISFVLITIIDFSLIKIIAKNKNETPYKNSF